MTDMSKGLDPLPGGEVPTRAEARAAQRRMTDLPTTAEAWRLTAHAFERERDEARAEAKRLRKALTEATYWLIHASSIPEAEALGERLAHQGALDVGT